MVLSARQHAPGGPVASIRWPVAPRRPSGGRDSTGTPRFWLRSMWCTLGGVAKASGTDPSVNRPPRPSPGSFRSPEPPAIRAERAPAGHKARSRFRSAELCAKLDHECSPPTISMIMAASRPLSSRSWKTCAPTTLQMCDALDPGGRFADQPGGRFADPPTPSSQAVALSGPHLDSQ